MSMPPHHRACAAGSRDRAGFDVQRVREDFPILQQKVHGKPLVYLDNAATTQKPQAVLDAMRHYYEHDNANVHRGVHLLSERATERLRGGPRARCSNSSTPAACARSSSRAAPPRRSTSSPRPSAGSTSSAGDEVLVTCDGAPLQHRALADALRGEGRHLRVVPITDAGELRLDELREAARRRARRLVAVAHVSNALGTINPVKEIIELAHRRGIPVLVDGAQAVPHLPRRRAGAGLRFLRLLRAQGLRPDRHRRPVRQGRHCWS